MTQGQPTAYASVRRSSSGNATTTATASAVAVSTQGSVHVSTLTIATRIDTEDTFCTPEFQAVLKEANLTMVKAPRCDQKARFIPEDQGSPCRVHHNRKYKVWGSDQMADTYTASPRLCCNLCRVINGCNSWWRKYGNGKCFLNRIVTGGWNSHDSAGGNI
eukprot:g3758.t1